MGPFFVRTAAVSVENTHNFAGGAVLPLADLEALRTWADVGRRRPSTSTARGCGTPHVATGVPFAAYGALRRRDVACASPRGWGPGRLAARRLGRDAIAEARVCAQADGRRDAPGRDPGGGGAARPRPPRRAARRRPRPRAAARPRPAASTRETVETNIVVVDRATTPRVRGRRPRGGVLVAPVGPRAVRLVTHLDVSQRRRAARRRGCWRASERSGRARRRGTPR